jgi:hypothetical protein
VVEVAYNRHAYFSDNLTDYSIEARWLPTKYEDIAAELGYEVHKAAITERDCVWIVTLSISKRTRSFGEHLNSIFSTKKKAKRGSALITLLHYVGT